MTSPFKLDLAIARALGAANTTDCSDAVASFKAHLQLYGYRIVDATPADDEPAADGFGVPGDEILRTELDQVIEDVEADKDLRGDVAEICRFARLPSLWVTRIAIDDDGSTQIEEFGTEAEARSFAEYAYGAPSDDEAHSDPADATVRG